MTSRRTIIIRRKFAAIQAAKTDQRIEVGKGWAAVEMALEIYRLRDGLCQEKQLRRNHSKVIFKNFSLPTCKWASLVEEISIS